MPWPSELPPRIAAIRFKAQLLRQLLGVVRRTMERAAVYIKRRNLALAFVRSNHKLRRSFRLLDINLLEGNAALLEKVLGAAAVGAPGCRINFYNTPNNMMLLQLGEPL